MAISDLILIERIQNKDGIAFKEFYDRYAALLFKWALRRIRSEELTQEITQEFWANFWLNPAQIKTDINGYAKDYLLHIFTYRVIDYIRSQMSRKSLVSIDDEFKSLSQSLSYSNISEEIEEREIYMLIDEIISTLPELTQKVFIHRWKDDLSTTETAQMLNIDEKAVYNRMYLAINTVREKVSEMLDDENQIPKIRTLHILVWFSLML